MTQETIKWKLFLFSLLGKAKQWYAHTVGGVNGNWDKLRDKFCLAFFPISKVAALRIELLSFQQKEKETLGAAWARFLSLMNTGPNLSLPDYVVLYHFYLGLSKEDALQLDLSSRGSFAHKSISEGKAIMEKILENTSYTGIYDELPKQTIESSPDQQEEAPTTGFKIPSNSSHNLIAGEPPTKGTHHTHRDDESHSFTWPFEFKDDLFLDVDFGNTIEFPTSTSSYASNSCMRHQQHFQDIEGGSIHMEVICIPSPSMPTLVVSSKSILNIRGEVMSIIAITMTYPNVAEDSNCHEKEKPLSKVKDFIDEHGSYFITFPSIPCSYEKSPRSICNSAITCKIYNTFLLPTHKIFKKVVVDAFIYHEFCKSQNILA
jgi:hypothetical protein